MTLVPCACLAQALQCLASGLWSLTGCLICFSPPQRPHFCLRMCRLTVSAAYPSRLLSHCCRVAGDLCPVLALVPGGEHAGAPSLGQAAEWCLPRGREPAPSALPSPPGADLSGAGPGQPKRSLVMTSSVFCLCPPTGSAPGLPHPPEHKEVDTRCVTREDGSVGCGGHSWLSGNVAQKVLKPPV